MPGDAWATFAELISHAGDSRVTAETGVVRLITQRLLIGLGQTCCVGHTPQLTVSERETTRYLTRRC